MIAFKQQIRIAAITFGWLALIVLGSFSNALAQAQANAGDLTGVVTDPNGAVVAGATITASNNAINISRSVTSDGAGQYRIVNLPPAEYEVTVEAASFKKSVFPNVQVIIGQAVTLNTSLQLGAVGETVTINGAQTEVVETTRSAVTNTIDQQRIENLPINQRDYTNFALTASNVNRDNGRPIGPAPTSGLNFGGQRGRSNLVQVDGADFTDNSVNAARATISQEGVQEFQVVSNSFAPEFGRSAGGVVNVVTKRGSNAFTGNVFGFIRDKKIQAINAFAPRDFLLATSGDERPPFTRTQSGVTFGGPLAKNHTYFFFAFERRQRNESGFFTSNVGQNLTSTVTLPAALGGQTYRFLTPQQAAFAQQLLGVNPAGAVAYLTIASSGGNTGLTGTNPIVSPGGGFGVPAGQQVGGRFLLTGAPVPIGTQNSQGQFIAFRPLNNLAKIFPVTDRTNFFSLRLDQNIDQNNQFYIRFGYNPSNITGIQVESQNQSLGQNDFSRTGIQKVKDYAAVAGLTSTIGNIVNEARFNFGKRRFSFTSQNGDAVAFNVADTAFIGRELFSPVRRDEIRFQLADNATFVTGGHTLKFGADFNWVDIPRFEFELNFAGLFNFGANPVNNFIPGLPAPCPTLTTTPSNLSCTPQLNPVQSYGLGFPTNFIQGIGDPVGSYNNKPIAFFAQDSWKVFRNLTINYGARYDVELTRQIAPIGFTDPLSRITLSASDVLAAQDALNVQQGIPRDFNNIAPRFGFAYDLAGNGKTVLRGAVGLFYDHPLLAIAANSDIADSTQQQQTILTAGSPSPTALLNAAQVFQGTVCGTASPNPLCPPGLRTPGVAASSEYQFGRQRFNDQTFPGFGPVLPFTLPVSKDFKYANAIQANLAIERQLDKNTSVEVKYLFVGTHNLPHPVDINAPDTNLQIENFRRCFGRLPTNTTEVSTVNPAACTAGTFVNVIPGIISVNTATGQRVIAPAIANFFRPSGPNYFLAAALSGGAVSKAVLDSQLGGTLRTTGLLSPFGSVNVQSSDGNSEYNAMTVDVKRRFANNFTFLASYTFSKSIDDSSDLQTLLLPQDNRNFRAERSLSLFDQRHRFVFSSVIASPTKFRKSDNFLYRFLADFAVAPIFEISSGRPFNIITNVDTNNDQSSSTDRPSVASDGTLFIPGPFQTGNLGRNQGITHSYSSLDLRVTRAIRFGERIRLDLIAEGFNLFNRFNEAAVSPNVDAVNQTAERSKSGQYFSRPTAAFDPRQFQFGAKLNF
ncbi:MAG: carboxypeptidase regulatory-like domain-containing protein [Pyrinomonadaceae bacterium]